MTYAEVGATPQRHALNNRTPDNLPPPRLWACTWGVEVDGQQKAPERAWEAGQGLIDRKNGGNLLSRKLYMHYHRQCGV